MSLDSQNWNSTSLDGIALGDGETIKLVNQSDPSHNGTWFVRAADFDGGSSRNLRVPATEVEEGGSR